ncbi:unnamed protein product [Triticum turgidum subsp. durum]|uniref:Uncharacterized protein n=2 Tax=Triticum TaxID=4564 RepID=A0A9R0VZJ3_TRITD|nr:unnamed protein product [Triticum turgidum subsp. durum]
MTLPQSHLPPPARRHPRHAAARRLPHPRGLPPPTTFDAASVACSPIPATTAPLGLHPTASTSAMVPPTPPASPSRRTPPPVRPVCLAPVATAHSTTHWTSPPGSRGEHRCNPAVASHHSRWPTPPARHFPTSP